MQTKYLQITQPKGTHKLKVSDTPNFGAAGKYEEYSITDFEPYRIGYPIEILICKYLNSAFSKQIQGLQAEANTVANIMRWNGEITIQPIKGKAGEGYNHLYETIKLIGYTLRKVYSAGNTDVFLMEPLTK